MKNLVALLAASCLAGTAVASSEVDLNRLFSFTSIHAMEKVFFRSEEAHQTSMVSIAATMSSTEHAFAVLKAKNMTNPALVQIEADTFGKKNLRQTPAEKYHSSGKGYSGIDGARRLLNSMIFESNTKYDSEIAKCTDFYSSQCGLLKAARGEISASNYIAANSRMLILNSQSTINRCEQTIPTNKWQLKKHKAKCKREIQRMNERLKVLVSDIAVMTMILKMTDCAAKKMLMQQDIGVMKCEDPCTKAYFLDPSVRSVLSVRPIRPFVRSFRPSVCPSACLSVRPWARVLGPWGLQYP